VVQRVRGEAMMVVAAADARVGACGV